MIQKETFINLPKILKQNQLKRLFFGLSKRFNVLEPPFQYILGYKNAESILTKYLLAGFGYIRGKQAISNIPKTGPLLFNSSQPKAYRL
jgi:hypothetical protein